MIYRDILGIPVSGATVSFSTDIFSGGSAYRLHTTAENYSGIHKWDGDIPVEEISQYLGGLGFDCSVGNDGYGRPLIKCIHQETQRLIDTTRATENEKFAGAERGYVRFGGIPEGGKSKNYRDNTLECGVSCFEAEFAKDGSYRLILTPELEVSYLTVMWRDAYRLYGECVGIGADGEPVLAVERAEVLYET